MKTNNLQELTSSELEKIDGGVIFCAAFAFACAAAFMTGMGVGVAIYAATK